MRYVTRLSWVMKDAVSSSSKEVPTEQRQRQQPVDPALPAAEGTDVNWRSIMRWPKPSQAVLVLAALLGAVGVVASQDGEVGPSVRGPAVATDFPPTLKSSGTHPDAPRSAVLRRRSKVTLRSR